MPECYPINSFGRMLNPRLNRGVSINRLNPGFPLNICGNDTLTLVIPECPPLRTCGDKHYRVSPQLSYPNAFIGYPFLSWIPATSSGSGNLKINTIKEH